MGVDELLQQPCITREERASLRNAIDEFIGEGAVSDLHHIIYRANGQHRIDFDIVTKDGTVIEVFGRSKGPKKYEAQLRRIADTILDLQECGEQYSGNFYIFYRSLEPTPRRLRGFISTLQQEYPDLRINLVNSSDC